MTNKKWKSWKSRDCAGQMSEKQAEDTKERSCYGGSVNPPKYKHKYMLAQYIPLEGGKE